MELSTPLGPLKEHKYNATLKFILIGFMKLLQENLVHLAFSFLIYWSVWHGLPDGSYHVWGPYLRSPELQDFPRQGYLYTGALRDGFWWTADSDSCSKILAFDGRNIVSTYNGWLLYNGAPGRPYEAGDRIYIQTQENIHRGMLWLTCPTNPAPAPPSQY